MELRQGVLRGAAFQFLEVGELAERRLGLPGIQIGLVDLVGQRLACGEHVEAGDARLRLCLTKALLGTAGLRAESIGACLNLLVVVAGCTRRIDAGRFTEVQDMDRHQLPSPRLKAPRLVRLPSP